MPPYRLAPLRLLAPRLGEQEDPGADGRGGDLLLRVHHGTGVRGGEAGHRPGGWGRVWVCGGHAGAHRHECTGWESGGLKSEELGLRATCAAEPAGQRQQAGIPPARRVAAAAVCAGGRARVCAGHAGVAQGRAGRGRALLHHQALPGERSAGAAGAGGLSWCSPVPGSNGAKLLLLFPTRPPAALLLVTAGPLCCSSNGSSLAGVLAGADIRVREAAPDLLARALGPCGESGRAAWRQQEAVSFAAA